MKTSDAVLNDLSNGDRFSNSFTETGKSNLVSILSVEFFEDLVDEDTCLDVPVDTNDSIGDGLALGAHLAILLHLRLVGVSLGRRL